MARSKQSFRREMKAIIYTDYGPADVLQFTEVARPVPGDDEVLIRVHAASVNPLDWHFMRGSPRLVRAMTGWRRPKIPRLGADVAGEVEAVGRNVTRFQPGDVVFGSCRGSFAEYVCASGNALVKKPAGVTFVQAAAVPVAAVTALQGLRDRGRLQRGQKVLINGAAGGVGTFAVQIAKTFGAEVTGVCSAGNLGMVRSIGADRVVDYAREDFTKGERRYDLILDMVGNHSLPAYRRAMTGAGVLVMVGGPDTGILSGMLAAFVLSRFGRRKMLPFLARMNNDDLNVLSGLLETGRIIPVIDRSYALHDVPEALRYAEKGHAKGKVVITMEHHGDA
jgi:NADPH:quinone reductase-like Zn-dependent oxidoreductase